MIGLELQREQAIATAEIAMEGAARRMRDAHEAELTQLRLPAC